MRKERLASASVAEFLRKHRHLILDRWLSSVRHLPKGRELDLPALRDDIITLLRDLADTIDVAKRTKEVQGPVAVTQEHAHVRLDQGYSVSELLVEYSILRETIIDVYREQGLDDAYGLLVLNVGLDQIMMRTVETFIAVRQRTSAALDRISSAAVGSRGLDAFLKELITVLVETVDVVDTVTVLLRERDMLHVRASVGFDEESTSRFSVRIGEGFAGRIAHTRKPFAVRNANADPLVDSAHVGRGVRGLYGVPLLFEGELVGVVHMGSLTAFEFEQEDQRLLTQVAARAAAAIVHHQLRNQLDEARESFVNVLAHDLKSPLATIRGLAALGMRHAATTDDRIATERFRKIDNQVDHMVRLLDDLLDARLLEAGRLSIRKARLDLCEVVKEAVDEACTTTTRHRIRFNPKCEATIEADRVRIVQVMSNLLGNAIKYSPNGGTIQVEVARKRSEVVVSVRDQGVGIAPENLTSIFREYERTRSGSRVASGHGLGLFIASQLVSAHGGRIWAESTPGKGSTFSFSLPDVSAPPRAPRAGSKRPRSRR